MVLVISFSLIKEIGEGSWYFPPLSLHCSRLFLLIDEECQPEAEDSKDTRGNENFYEGIVHCEEFFEDEQEYWYRHEYPHAHDDGLNDVFTPPCGGALCFVHGNFVRLLMNFQLVLIIL